MHQGDIKVINIYASNIRGPKYSVQMLTDLKSVRDNEKIVVER